MSFRAFLDDFNKIVLDSDENISFESLSLTQGGRSVDFTFDSKKKTLYLDNLDVEKQLALAYQDIIYPVEYRFIFQTKRFDDEYVPCINELGSFYTKEKTTFNVWAPFEEDVFLILDQKLKMEKRDKGVFSLTLEGDLNNRKYHYLVDGKEIIDPFSYAKSFDGKDSYVVDLDKLNKETIALPKEDVFIDYELAVPDFSYDTLFNYSGKLKAFTEEGLSKNDFSIGIDYIKELGVSHIQILPVLDFDDDHSEYNWGYNPVGYNTIKSSYLQEDSGIGQINELRDIVNKVHQKELRVIFDVVYNHVYNTENFILNKLCPYYFYRYKGNRLAKGTGLGNEVRTESKFMRQYLIEMSYRLVKLYDIDGLRYDLSGIIDIQTIKEIEEKIKTIKPNFKIVLEGWNMGNSLPFAERCCQENSLKYPSGIFFNDFFRETIKEYASGKESLREEFKNAFLAKKGHLNQHQTLNYIECHDGYTYYDYLKKKGVKEEFFNSMFKLGLAITVLAKGNVFVQAGQEFLRTKKGNENSYNLPLDINKLDWDLAISNKEYVEYFKDLIKTRKEINDYYDKDFEVIDYYEVVVFKCEDLLILVNPCGYDHIYTDGNRYQIILDSNGKQNYINDGVDVKAFSLCVIKQI